MNTQMLVDRMYIDDAVFIFLLQCLYHVQRGSICFSLHLKGFLSAKCLRTSATDEDFLFYTLSCRTRVNQSCIGQG